MKKEKIGLTPINWFLSILGIILLSCVVVLPPVFRVLFKEEEVTKLPEEAVIQEVTCMKDQISSDGYISNIVYEFSYYQNQIQTYSKITKSTYTDYSLYDTNKQTFGRYNLAFNILNGYRYVMEPDDENYVLTIEEEYDLTKFKNTVITIPGDTIETSVTSLYTSSDSMSSVKSDLVSDGYICR